MIFTVHEPPQPPLDRIDRAEKLLFLADSFNWTAAVLGPLWLGLQRLWLALTAYVLAVVVVSGCLLALDPHPGWYVLAAIGLHAVVGYEANELVREKLLDEGWALLGAVEGKSLIECERRFLDGWFGGGSTPPTVGGATAGTEPPTALGSSASVRPTTSGWSLAGLLRKS